MRKRQLKIINKIMRIKYVFSLAILTGFTVYLFSCNKTNNPTLLGDWITKSEFNGLPRASAVSFVVNDIAYVGTGFNSSLLEYYNDFWKYDAKLNFWQQVADFPGVPRSSAVAFAVNGKGYVGTGSDGNNDLKDFYEYDPAKNTWKKIPDFGGSARHGAVALGLGDYGYVGTGNDGSDLKDFWQYNPADTTWTEIPSFGGSKRQNGVAFVLNNKGYVLTGSHNGIYLNDMWALNPTLLGQNTFPWEQKKNLDASTNYTIEREGACALVLGSDAYIAVGRQSSYISSTWHYLSSVDSWEAKTPFETTLRSDAISFSTDGKAFVALGRNGSLFLDDTYQFDPNAQVVQGN